MRERHCAREEWCGDAIIVRRRVVVLDGEVESVVAGLDGDKEPRGSREGQRTAGLERGTKSLMLDGKANDAAPISLDRGVSNELRRPPTRKGLS